MIFYAMSSTVYFGEVEFGMPRQDFGADRIRGVKYAQFGRIFSIFVYKLYFHSNKLSFYH